MTPAQLDDLIGEAIIYVWGVERAPPSEQQVGELHAALTTRTSAVAEDTLPERLRERLAEIRATNNIVSLTPLHRSSRELLCLAVPTDAVDEGGGWQLPDRPFLLRIPHRPH
jgi:hypothetical protein